MAIKSDTAESLDIGALRLLALVEREGSILGAARLAALSRATVRRKLEGLQAEVGVPLFDKSRAGVQLTEAGRLLSRRASELLAELDLVVDSAREVALAPPRPLSLTIPLGLQPHSLGLVTRVLQSMWPGTCVHFHARAQVRPDLAAPTDLYLSLADEIPPGPFEVIELPEVEVCLFASAAYLQAHAPITSVSDLAPHPLVMWSGPEDQAPTALPLRAGGELPVAPTLVSNDVHAIHELAEAGFGIGYAGHHDLPGAPPSTLQRVLPERVGQSLRPKVLITRGVAESPRIRHLVETIRRLVAEPQR